METPTSAQKIELMKLVSQLQHLEGIPWVHTVLEDAKIALHNRHRLASDSLGAMRVWVKRWNALDRRLQALYRDSLQRGFGAVGDAHNMGGDILTEARYTAVCIAMWKILNGGSSPSGSTYGALRALWVEKYGYSPPIEMVPKPEHK